MKAYCPEHRSEFHAVRCDEEGCNRLAVVSEEEPDESRVRMFEAMERAQTWAISPEDVERLEAYREVGRPLGGFLEAVIRNDLTDAMNLATEESIPRIPGLARWCYRNLPLRSRRSAKAYQKWIHKCGLQGEE